MKTIKRVLALISVLILFTFSFASCTSKGGEKKEEKFKIISTIFPQYDWLKNVIGDKADNFDLTLLVDNGVDLHSYQPSVEDIANISTCDMFIYVGGESDGWVKDVLKNAKNKDMKVINLVEAMGSAIKEEEIVEGMEHDHDHGEVDPADVKDRPLSDWAGDWKSIEASLNSGALDDYVKHTAEEHETEVAAQKTSFAERWKSDYSDLKIEEGSVTFNNSKVSFKYSGFKIVESDHGASVWYGFEADPPVADAPKYIAFSDHGTGGEHEHEHEDEHEDDHETPHYHLRYGNDSFEGLTTIEGWSPTYFLASASGEEVAEAMSEHGHSHEGELDEHVWLSLRNAAKLTTLLSEKVSELDKDNAAVYKANAEEYNKALDALDVKYKDAVKSASNKVLLFGDRFPFRYLVDDYNLTYFAAFSGCSAETEASFETVAFLSQKTDELKLKNILTIETSDQSIAKTIRDNTSDKGQTILTMDSIQSVKSSDITAGATYISIMEKNLDVLKNALN